MSTPHDPNAPLPAWVRAASWHCDDPVATARALRPVLEAGAAEGERIGRLCDTTARALCESGLFGVLVPRELGGIEADPRTLIDVFEEIAHADGSAGWVMIATTFCIAGATSWLGDPVIAEMFGGRGFIAAAQIAPNGTARRVDDGWRIEGQFHFGSGSQLSSWFMGAFVEHDEHGPVRDDAGAPRVMYVYGPREQVWCDPSSWDVTGLRATASHDFRFLDQVVSDDLVMVPARRARRGGPVMDIGVSLGHVAWSLGVSTRILDELAVLAARKQRQARARLVDQSMFQRDFGMHRASVEAARAYIRRVYDDWFADAREHGSAGLGARAAARLAACWGTRVSADVAQFANLAAGTDALRNTEDNVLQRCFRDLEAAAVHRHVDDNVLVDATSVLLGVAPAGLVL